MIKKIFDITLSFILLILLFLPFCFLISILFLLNDGPIFFIQKRVGKDKQVFKLIKLRTMCVKTQNIETHLINHNQITRIGRFLRKFKIDEIPQIINILLGEMSLVGPRPCLTNQKELIFLRDKNKIFSIKPGITGLAQVNKVDMSRPKFLTRIDKLYLNKMNIFLDIYILIRTFLGKGFGDQIKK